MTIVETHPWIDFKVNLSTLPHTFWMAVGEARSKCDHLSQVPLRNDIAIELYTMYLAKGVHATTAIEGNTLTEEQVLEHLEGSLELPPSQHYLEQEIDNIAEACKVIYDDVFDSRRTPRLTVDDIFEYNRRVLDGLELESGVVPGEIRTHDVVVGTVYKGPPASECERLLREMCDWLNSPDFIQLHERLDVGAAILRAVLAHLYIAWIHPFGDGNGRTARLVEFHILVASGVPSAAAHLLSNHYNLTRTRYYVYLREASMNGGDPLPFICYAIEGFVDGMREQIGFVLKTYLRDLVWRDFVDEQLHHESDARAARHKELLVALFRKGEPVRRGGLMTLSPDLATHYASKTPRTLSRDLNELKKAQLIRQTPKGYIAREDKILRFLPPRTALPGVEGDNAPELGAG